MDVHFGLTKDVVAIEHYGALGDPAFEPSWDWLGLPETREILEQSFISLTLLAKNVAWLKDKYSLSEIALETWESIPFVVY